MSTGFLLMDDNGHVALGLQDDATGQVIPVHIGAKVTGADGKTYAKLDVNATVSATIASVGTNAAAIPTSSDLMGAKDGSGNLQPVQTDGTNLLTKVNAALPAGTNVIGHVIVDSAGSVTITTALPAGTNVIGHVIVDSAGSVSVTSLPALPAGSNNIGGVEIIDSAGTNKLAIDSSGRLTLIPTQTVTANAGTNLNTSLLALEAGGNLATLVTNTADLLADGDNLATIQTNTANIPAKGQATMANSLPVAIASNQGAIGSVVAQAVAGTALAADQTNSELRVSNYVQKTTAGDTALTLGQTTMANSLPVTMASDQGNIKTVSQASAGTNLGIVEFSKNNATVPANTASNTVIKNASGYLCTVVVTTTGTAGISIYDNASTNSGTVLLTIPAAAAVGTIYTLYGAAANGITAAGVTNCPGLTVFYV